MNQKGFTLIELLVVIAIIGLLASVVLTAIPEAQKRARDAKRLQSVSQIVTALRVYYINQGFFPTRTADSCCDGWDQGPCAGDNTFIDDLVTSGELPVVPVDPVGGSGTNCYGYDYYRYGAGYAGCDVSRGAFFVLGIRDMESSTRPHSQSPGWSCPSRDWQTEFDWVIGGFEN